MVNVRVRHESESTRESVWFTHLPSITDADALVDHVQEAGGIFHAPSGRRITRFDKQIVKDGSRCYVELILLDDPPAAKSRRRRRK